MKEPDELDQRLGRFYQAVSSEVPSLPSRWRQPSPSRRPVRLVSALASAALLVVAVTAIAIRASREEGQISQSQVQAAQARALASAAALQAGGAAVQDIGVIAGGGAWILNASGLYRTDDWGAHWRSVAPPVASPGASLVAATFADSGHGWAAAAAPGRNAVAVYRSTDGGANWTGSLLPATFPDGIGATHLSFADSLQGWAVVDLPHGGAAGRADVFVTGDGGSTWTELPPTPATAGVRILEASAGWGVDDGGRLYRTTDGARTWIDVGLPVPVQLPVFFGAEGVALGSGPSGLTVAVTHDGGDTWTLRPGPAGVDLSRYGSVMLIAFAAADPRHLVLYPGPALYRSDDGGASWQTIHPNMEWPGAAALRFTSSSDGWIVVTSGLCSGDKSSCGVQSLLLVTRDSGRTLQAVAPPSG